MAKDVGMTIRKGIVVSFLPCLVAFWRAVVSVFLLPCSGKFSPGVKFCRFCQSVQAAKF